MRKVISDYDQLLNEWNYSKNGDLNPNSISFGSATVVWWKCSVCGHEWKAKVSSRTSGSTGCPVCSKKKQQQSFKESIIKSRGSLPDKFPELRNEWNCEKNEKPASSYTPGSGESVWWKCSVCEHEWKARIYARTNGSGCPRCARARHRNKMLSL